MQNSDPNLATALSLPQSFALSCKANGPLRVRATHRQKETTQEFAVNAPYAFVGRSAGAGVRLDDPSVSQCHAYLQVVEGVPFCIDLGSRAGVVWDDGTQGQGWVSPGQTLRIGAFDVRVESPAGPATAGEDEAGDSDRELPPVLTTAFAEVHGPASQTGSVHALDRAITLVGRHPSCDLRLLDVTIAYFQAALVNTADGVWLVDTMTRKGAILNGRGTRLARVRDGDLLEFGKVSLVLRIGSHHGTQLALRPTAVAAQPIDAVSAVSTAVAQSLAGAIVPVGEMMKQFQQCYVAMAQMFAAMQQEHAALVGEQIRQIQELAAEIRDLRGEVHHNGSPTTPAAPAPAGPTAPPPAARPAPQPPNPTLKVPSGAEGQALSDAHAWFMERLAQKTNPAGGA
jgi:pSer/pThr/pTyr-binding forkhead associated (FHA) protein